MVTQRRITKIVSGGQTGVDRAALDVALALAIPCGGWCPQGRRAEDGQIASKYPLTETDDSNYSVRTKLNILHSDATLIFCYRIANGGTALTLRLVSAQSKPYLVIDLLKNIDWVSEIHRWIERCNIKQLNIAGPRASKANNVYNESYQILYRWLAG